MTNPNSQFLSISDLAQLWVEALLAEGVQGNGTDCPQQTAVNCTVGLVHRLMPRALFSEHLIIPMAKTIAARLGKTKVSSIVMPPPAGALEHFGVRLKNVAGMVSVIPTSAGVEQVITVFSIWHEALAQETLH
jgi:hypothetical protein